MTFTTMRIKMVFRSVNAMEGEILTFNVTLGVPDLNRRPIDLHSSAAGFEPARAEPTRFQTKVFGYRPGNNSSTFNVSTHEGAGTFQALANKELTSPKANWASGL
ncbi:hypothetical protein H8356DRAFT_1431101 [Neocallimastix lanati (nom. inval.)]|nr:hypothetical protein H8356DRAFT_1431101 [Neocallimastix sp. JGI-2020a]